MTAIATTTPLDSDVRKIRVALAGNPNSGKTSLFNALTGSRQHVGNYPGVTVERRGGSFFVGDVHCEITDLPGTYSLTSYSPEERIAQNELLEIKQDVVVVVVDSTNLERSLVLLTQVMQFGVNPVLCLNMSDEASAAGQDIDIEQMQSLLGIPIVETVGHRGFGVENLKRAIVRAAQAGPALHRLVFGERFDQAIAEIEHHLGQTTIDPVTHAWVATKLLVDDQHFVEQVLETGEHGRTAIAAAEQQRQKIEQETGLDISLFVTDRYFGFVDGLLREVVRAARRPDARALSDKIDSILVHRIMGLPIFAAVMFGIFWLTFIVGEMPMSWIESGFDALAAAVSSIWPAGSDSPLRSLLIDGIIGGVGGVIVFLPNILLLFLGLAFLEDSGYMARAAFLMDRVMHRFGLHGKSFIPMVTGFGCSIPGIMATRILENERDRLTTMLVLPLMSCGARLPIWLLIIPAFYPPAWRAPVLWLIYSLGILLALVLALLLRKSLLRGEEAPFVMELPPYRMPTPTAMLRKMTERAGLYLRKAGTVILAVSILMWVATAYPKAESYELDAQIAAGRVVVAPTAAPMDPLAPLAPSDRPEVITPADADRRRAAEDLRASVAGRVGSAIEPVIRPLGFDWRIGTAMLGALAAKEVFVAQLGIVYSMGEAHSGTDTLRAALARDYSPLVGFCLMLFMLISAPCVATIAITRRESGSWKWALLQLIGLTTIAYVATLVAYNIGRLFV